MTSSSPAPFANARRDHNHGVKKRLRYMTPLNCVCGARGDLVWVEDETSQLGGSVNYEIVSVTELFLLQDQTIVCRLCDRSLPPMEEACGETCRPLPEEDAVSC